MIIWFQWYTTRSASLSRKLWVYWLQIMCESFLWLKTIYNFSSRNLDLEQTGTGPTDALQWWRIQKIWAGILLDNLHRTLSLGFRNLCRLCFHSVLPLWWTLFSTVGVWIYSWLKNCKINTFDVVVSISQANFAYKKEHFSFLFSARSTVSPEIPKESKIVEYCRGFLGTRAAGWCK